mgnify:CR=1 FL=1|jgi:hypothetical protein|tara:strand:- start:40 stop:249 length:210 start_codon:yes stop_codon:yes gene_type:complete
MSSIKNEYGEKISYDGEVFQHSDIGTITLKHHPLKGMFCVNEGGKGVILNENEYLIMAKLKLEWHRKNE